MTTGQPTGGHPPLPVDEPPFDPDYDAPPSGGRNGTRPVAAPAQDTSAERAVLGAMLVDPHLIDDVTALITPDDYYQPAHALIHDAIVRVYRTLGLTVDPITVATELTRTGDLQHAGGPLALASLYADVPLAANATHYATLVRDNARRRTLYDLGTHLRQLGTTGRPEDLDTAYDTAYARLDQAAANYGPGHTEATTTGWEPLDLEPVLAGQEIDPPPVLLARTDGQHLIYDGAIHSISGEPSSGKTWFALLAALQLLQQGETVVMLDFEDRPSRVVGRLLALGATPTQVRAHFRYIRPHTALDDLGRPRLAAAVAGSRLVILDGVTEAMDTHGLDLNSNNDVATFLKLLPRWIVDQGPAVLLIDHVVKDPERQSRWALGGQHKLAGLDGVAYTMKSVERFGRGKIGHARITVGKDRPGHVEAFLLGRTAGELWLDASASDVLLVAEIRPPREAPVDDAGILRPTHLMEKVSRFVEANPNVARRVISDTVMGKATYVRQALDRLILEGWIEIIPGPHGAKNHRVVTPYREDSDATPDSPQGTLT